jgi:Flp pilus assembly pilin Flp
VRKIIARLSKDQKGQDIVEYALLLLLIALMIIASTRTLGQVIENTYVGVTNTVSAATSAAGAGNGGGK